jgi:DNA-binding SARP family transcriptional activator
MATLGAVIGTAVAPPRLALAPYLRIVTLGRFAIVREGEPLTVADWQSRKARDLLKILVSREGRTITRDAVAESLWPGQDASVVGARLSVALSTMRKVLDPEKRFAADHFVAADGRSITLRVEHLDLDLMSFLHAARDAEAAASRDDWAGAEPYLALAEQLYAGDFLPGDQFEDWSVDCRERARSAAVTVCRLQARAGACNPDRASRHLRRLLELDPYDEPAWLDLIGAEAQKRHHGEARRQYAAYARRMTEIGIPPIPFPAAGGTR